VDMPAAAVRRLAHHLSPCSWAALRSVCSRWRAGAAASLHSLHVGPGDDSEGVAAGASWVALPGISTVHLTYSSCREYRLTIVEVSSAQVVRVVLAAASAAWFVQFKTAAASSSSSWGIAQAPMPHPELVMEHLAASICVHLPRRLSQDPGAMAGCAMQQSRTAAASPQPSAPRCIQAASFLVEQQGDPRQLVILCVLYCDDWQVQQKTSSIPHSAAAAPANPALPASPPPVVE
jgi:hypothetical protein